ncbi:MAG: flagellar biosynthesis protein FlgA [Azospirillum sp. 47_25]|nr:MAG: flagellar biosynthesis protein FlgA [Azospirillum sp. 47_25]
MNTVLFKKSAVFSIIGAVFLLAGGQAAASSRIKDIADFEGVRENQLVGYGLVVGLNGTGDNIKSINFAKESLISMLDQLGINARDGQLKSKNIAAVMVTASLPPFARQGSRIDVMVSAMGDAKSLQGGTLIATPLSGANGEVYAVAQGQIATGSVSAQGNNASVTRGVPTSGRIANGAIIENEIDFALDSLKNIRIALRNPDFTTARRISDAINAMLGQPASKALDPATVDLQIPQEYEDKVVDLMTKVEQLQVQPDQLAKVVIDESSGIIVIGKDVKINRLAIAQGNLTIKISEIPMVSQPLPFSNGTTITQNVTAIDVNEEVNSRLSVLDTGVNLQELVDGLNALGVTPRDLISILQAVKASGALQADIEVI